MGLRADGTVATAGARKNDYGQCATSDWKDIGAISAGGYVTVGLHADGSVVTAGKGTSDDCDVSSWSDTIAVSAGSEHALGLREDGTVTATEYRVSKEVQDMLDELGETMDDWASDDGQRSVSTWKLFESIDALEQDIQEAAERAERERKEAAERAERERQERIAALTAEKAKLEVELPTLKGLLAGMKRKGIDNRLAEIEAELKKLNA